MPRAAGFGVNRGHGVCRYGRLRLLSPPRSPSRIIDDIIIEKEEPASAG